MTPNSRSTVTTAFVMKIRNGELSNAYLVGVAKSAINLTSYVVSHLKKISHPSHAAITRYRIT